MKLKIILPSVIGLFLLLMLGAVGVSAALRPDFVSRAEFLEALVKKIKIPKTELQNKQNCFKDVKAQPFAKYVCFAKEKGMVSGYKDGRFKPESEIIAAEAFAAAIKAYSFPLAAADAAPVVPNQPWYAPHREFMHANNIFSKYEILPQARITSTQMHYLLRKLSALNDGKKKLAQERKIRSSGCGKDPPKTVPSSSTVRGVERSYITVIPRKYDANTPVPIVFAFHGRTNSNQMVHGYYHVEEAANGKAIFVYPAGLRSGRGYSWSNPGDPPDALRDYALFDQLLAEFSNNYCLNVDEVFVVGHSLGAWFTNSLACARGDKIRAIGSVGGGTTVLENCSGPAAALVMHNPKDNLVPFSQGEAARDQFIRQNMCSARTRDAAPKGLNCRAYTCGDDASFTWCPHREDYANWDGSYYPHTWPKDAGRAIWGYFENLMRAS